MSTPDRIRQVKTTKEKHGADHYHKIGGKGGKKSPTKFSSESGKQASLKRWADWRKKQKEKESNSGEHI